MTSTPDAASTCGCCGPTQADPSVSNPPGRSKLAYRSGTYATVLRRMLGALEQHLPALTARGTEDPSIALLDAFATLADVVTFYQERIANEGYLGTATEQRSLLELARSIGYELRTWRCGRHRAVLHGAGRRGLTPYSSRRGRRPGAQRPGPGPAPANLRDGRGPARKRDRQRRAAAAPQGAVARGGSGPGLP